jgi:broad specificity phosphatase PhoE
MTLPTSNKTTVIVVRHGEASPFDGLPNFKEEKIDHQMLTVKGSEDVQKLGKHFYDSGLKVDIIITSSFKRARETATILGENLGIKKCDILITDSLVEINEEEEGEFVNFPNISLKKAEKRIKKWFVGFMANPIYVGKTILLVSHEHAIGSMLKCANNLEASERIVVDTASQTKFVFEDGNLQVSQVNFTIN